jgi:ABC-type nitrate/sulfonate/bicarbonate transport system substrate-binding protein
MTSSTCEVRAGFMPLVDCAPLVIARELGFAEQEGIELQLVRETSWATIRDRLAVSHLDVAHILAPMPVAANLALGPLQIRMLVPMALGTGANSVTVSRELWQGLSQYLDVADFDAVNALRALGRVVRKRETQSLPCLSLGVVHPYSAHHYELAYWLASASLIPGAAIDLVVIPPPLMPVALASGHIDGFCAGEPWGTVAATDGNGVILTTNSQIWQNSPEKVLGVREDWAETHGDGVSRLVRALYRSAEWCDAIGNQEELATILADDRYVGQKTEQIRPCLARRLKTADGELLPVEGFLNFASKAATFPWTSHALWFFSQMVRWGQVSFSQQGVEIARGTYRPDLYRAALEPLGIEIPSANAKVEGALKIETPAGSALGQLRLGPDTFFDGEVFDPDRLEAYLEGFKANDSL